MPKITAITQQKKLQHRFNLFVDGKFEIGVDGSLVLKYDLKVGDRYTPELKRKLENDDQVEMVYHGLLNFIAYRERCQYEVHQWLFKKGYLDFEDDLVGRLKANNFLSDPRFARLFIRDRVKLRGWGPIRLRNELYKKRISKDIIEEACRFPDHRPFFRNIAVDEKGRIYIAEIKSILDKTVSIRCDIFSPDGYYLYTTTLPFPPAVIKSGFLYQLAEDEETGNIQIKRYEIKNWADIRSTFKS
jgi:SOS response regulatory protein OraA/RecX